MSAFAGPALDRATNPHTKATPATAAGPASSIVGHACPACCGSGHARGFRPCARCQGTGWIVTRREKLGAIGHLSFGRRA